MSKSILITDEGDRQAARANDVDVLINNAGIMETGPVAAIYTSTKHAIEGLTEGLKAMEAVASQLAVSKRTLHRRLQAEGTTFQSVLNSTRESPARHYLSRPSISAAEISFLLGYEEPSSFYRAFHNWTGETPERVRAEVLA
ncbi:MAG: helix-turn-helix domain-containing protein [Acidimicrobiales bacterium]